MKLKLLLLLPVLVIIAAIWLRWGYRTKEATLAGGPVERVTSTETETVLHLNAKNTSPVVIADSQGTATIQRRPGFEKVVLGQKCMETNQGQALVNWRKPLRYVPAQSFRVFSGAVYLGRLEMEDGTAKDFYLPKP